MKLKKFNYKRVNSTNDLAVKIIKTSNNDSGMVIADYQKKGRGRYGRKWISYKGNLHVSFFHELSKKNFSINRITKINCLLVRTLLSKYIKKKIIYKKPNDLLIENKKISGILQEIIFISKKVFLITGIGININKSPIIKKYPATNMCELTRKSINKVEVENNLKKLFEKNLIKLKIIK